MPPDGDGRMLLETDCQRVTTNTENCDTRAIRVWSGARDQAVIPMLTGPSVMTGAGALMPEALFPIHSRATVAL